MERKTRCRFDFERLPGKQKILTMTAATALGEVGPPAAAAIPELVRRSQDADYWVRSRAKAALINIRGEKLDALQRELGRVAETGNWNDLPQILVGLGPAAKPVVPMLVALLDDPVPSVKGPSSDILAELRLLRWSIRLGEGSTGWFGAWRPNSPQSWRALAP